MFLGCAAVHLHSWDVLRYTYIPGMCCGILWFTHIHVPENPEDTGSILLWHVHCWTLCTVQHWYPSWTIWLPIISLPMLASYALFWHLYYHYCLHSLLTLLLQMGGYKYSKYTLSWTVEKFQALPILTMEKRKPRSREMMINWHSDVHKWTWLVLLWHFLCQSLLTSTCQYLCPSIGSDGPSDSRLLEFYCTSPQPEYINSKKICGMDSYRSPCTVIYTYMKLK